MYGGRKGIRTLDTTLSNSYIRCFIYWFLRPAPSTARASFHRSSIWENPYPRKRVGVTDDFYSVRRWYILPTTPSWLWTCHVCNLDDGTTPYLLNVRLARCLILVLFYLHLNPTIILNLRTICVKYFIRFSLVFVKIMPTDININIISYVPDFKNPINRDII